MTEVRDGLFEETGVCSHAGADARARANRDVLPIPRGVCLERMQRPWGQGVGDRRRGQWRVGGPDKAWETRDRQVKREQLRTVVTKKKKKSESLNNVRAMYKGAVTTARSTEKGVGIMHNHLRDGNGGNY